MTICYYCKSKVEHDRVEWFDGEGTIEVFHSLCFYIAKLGYMLGFNMKEQKQIENWVKLFV